MIPIGDDRRIPIFPLSVYAIIALNIYAFYRELSGSQMDAFVNAYATIPFDITHGIQLAASPHPQILTIFSGMFLHASFWHLFFNMLFLAVFGPQMEYMLGDIGFIAFYLACGVIGSLTQIFVNPASHVPEIGASGAIAGVLGAYIVNFPTNSIRAILPIGCFPLFLRLPAILVIGIWAVVQFIHGFGTVDSRAGVESGASIAYFAHIGGFLAGVFLIYFFRPRKGRRIHRSGLRV
ncbi:MAG: rhomboid family intramembrane serine protease [Candidatus Eremiobacteraeota bacterium]|nr:rhomboid family intramembrane serine protease [Candidatus Eremiobacteraeota bacterium]